MLLRRLLLPLTPSTTALLNARGVLTNDSIRSHEGPQSFCYSTGAPPPPPPGPIKEFQQMPGPRIWPLVGNMPYIMGNKDAIDPFKMHRLWDRFLEEFGPIFKLKFIGMPVMVNSINPADAEVMYKSTAKNPIRVGFEIFGKLRSENSFFGGDIGLLPTNGEDWWRIRSKVQAPLLKPKNVAMYLPKVDKAAMLFMDRIAFLQQEHGGKMPNNFIQELYKWSLESVGLIALDQEMGCLAPNLSYDSPQLQMTRSVNDIFTGVNETQGFPLWKLYKTQAYKKLEVAHNTFTDIARERIEEAERSLAEAAAADDPNRTLTIMETFLNMEGLSKGAVTTMILDMLFAGVDTTANTIGFTLYLLSRNPVAQQKLQDEIDQQLGSNQQLTPEIIASMTYLNHVVKESLRMFPLTLGNGRLLTEDIVMSGHRVPKGTFAIIMNMTLCRMEEYFQRPDEFLPERWSRDRPLGAIHPYASLPFSTGTRMCIGKRIAEQEIYTLLIRLMQRYTVSFDNPEPMDVITNLILKPSLPLAFTFTSRRSP